MAGFLSGDIGFISKDNGFASIPVGGDASDCDCCKWQWTLDGCSLASKVSDVGWITPIFIIITFADIVSCSGRDIGDINGEHKLEWVSDGLWSTTTSEGLEIEYSGNNYTVDTSFVIDVENSIGEKVFTYISLTGNAGITPGSYNNDLTSCSANAGKDGTATIAYHIGYVYDTTMSPYPYDSCLSSSSEIEITISGATECSGYEDPNGTFTMDYGGRDFGAGAYMRTYYFVNTWVGIYPYSTYSIAFYLYFNGDLATHLYGQCWVTGRTSSFNFKGVAMNQDFTLDDVDDICTYFDSGSGSTISYTCPGDAAENAVLEWSQTIE